MSTATTPRLQTLYHTEVVKQLKKEFGFKSTMRVPRVQKVVINMGVGDATQNIKILDVAVEELTAIAGQKREGMPIACMVTLRGSRMWEFMDRLFNLSLPRVRDFRGVPSKSFDGRGNFTLGLKEQLIFHEIDYAKVDKIKGMNITFVTTAQTDAEAQALLSHLGMPFRK